MYRSLLITSVDDSVSAVTDLGAGFTVPLCPQRVRSFELASVLRQRTKTPVNRIFRPSAIVFVLGTPRGVRFFSFIDATRAPVVTI